MAILIAMTMSDHMSLADVKNRFSEVVDRIEREHGRVVVTRHGKPAAILMSVEDVESLEETLAILSDPQLVAEIRAGERDSRAGRTERLSRQDLSAEISRG